MTDTTAKTELVCVQPSGDRRKAIAEVGRPYQGSDGVWRCPIAFDGLFPAREVWGYDSLQALWLAGQTIRTLLRSLEARGWQVSIAGHGGMEFPLDRFFSEISHDTPSA
jgi:hypothetical protein